MNLEINIVDKSAIIDISGMSSQTLRKNTKTIMYYIGGKLKTLTPEIVEKSITNTLNKIGFDEIIKMTARDIKSLLASDLNKLKKSPSRMNQLTSMEPETKIIQKLDYLRPVDKKSGHSILLLGVSGSGKSTMLMDMIREIKPKDYDRILFFSESPNSQPLIEFLKSSKLKNVQIFDRFIPKIVLFLKRINDVFANKYKFLIILDDVINLRGDIINKLYCVYRNSNISTVLTSQYMKFLTPAARSSAWYTIITNLRPIDYEYVIKMYGLDTEGLTTPKFARILHERYKPYSKTMIIDNRTNNIINL